MVYRACLSACPSSTWKERKDKDGKLRDMSIHATSEEWRNAVNRQFQMGAGIMSGGWVKEIEPSNLKMCVGVSMRQPHPLQEGS